MNRQEVRCLLPTLLVVLAGFTPSMAVAQTDLGRQIAQAARQQIGVTTNYDPAYVALRYPGGDVPAHTGVCSDVVVRALREVGIDLQKEVHEDMRANFQAYPQNWGLKRPDKNIDHRRVPNLMRYFERRHITLKQNLNRPETYLPGDLVTWDLGRGVLHIGVVSDRRTSDHPLIIHNLGSGTKEENILLQYKVLGHYRIKRVPPRAPAPNAHSVSPIDVPRARS